MDANFSFNYGDIAGKTVVIAGSVFTLLQVVKKYTNWSFLQGNWALAANALCNVIGVVAITPPNKLATMDTAVQLLTGIFLASGFHGIVTTVIPATKPTPAPDNVPKTVVLTEEKPVEQPKPPVEPTP